jgi:hypothetical protein
MNSTLLPKPAFFALLHLIQFFVVGCKDNVRRTNQIIRIDMAVEGTAPNGGMALSIDTSLVCHYFGDSQSLKPGNYKGTIDKDLWDSLNVRLERIGYKQLDTIDNVVADVPSTEVVIQWKGHRKHLLRDLNLYPDSMSKVLQWITQFYKTQQLKPVKDTFLYNTVVQFPPIDQKILNGHHFPPPKL